jgi:hypothetical protein
MHFDSIKKEAEASFNTVGSTDYSATSATTSAFSAF